MKKILFSLFIVAALGASAQQKDSAQKQPAQAQNDSLTNDTPLISYKDYQEFIDKVVMDMPARYADQVRLWWATRIGQLVERRQKKK